jgi:glycosyltransferase involved in cell wall biosynthesis
MKKLLIVTDTIHPKRDGLTIFLENIIPRISKFYDIILFAPDFGKPYYKKVKLIKARVYNKTISDYKIPKINIKQIRKLVKWADIVFVQSALGPLGGSSVWYANKFKKKLISYVHAFEVNRFIEFFKVHEKIKNVMKPIFKWVERKIYNKCNLVLVSSEYSKRILRKLGVETEIEVVPLGLESKKFFPIENKGLAKKKIGLGKDKLIISYMGRISPEKNLKTLVDAYMDLKDEFKDIFLLIIGDGSKEQKRIFNEIKDFKITGFVENVLHYLQATDIFVMPSLTETTSLATLEAMSCGLPVITTRVGFMREYVINGKNGYFFPKRNSVVLASRIKNLIQDKKLMRKIGINARKSVSHFSWDITADYLRKSFGVF